MTKSLTDKWKNGELNDGWYYLKVKSELGNCPVISECVTNYSHLEPYSDFYEYDDSHVEEVLAPVPSYNEYLVLTGCKKLEEDSIQNLINEHFADLSKKVERLQEQINEANNVIKYYGMGVVTVTGYWGDKPYTKPEETTSFPEKALEYLKKWGVK